MNHGIIMDYPFVSYDLVTQDGFSPWTHPPMFMSHDLEQLLNQSQQQMNWLWQYTSPPVPSQHSANKPVSYPYRVWKHFVARLTHIKQTSNHFDQLSCSNCHGILGKVMSLTGWIEGQTLHVGFQALEHRGQLLHQLPGHGLTAN